MKYVRQVVLSEEVGTVEGSSTRSLTAAEGKWCIQYLLTYLIKITSVYTCDSD